MSAWSACCDSFMNTANVVCIDQRLTMPSRTPDPAHNRADPVGYVDQLDALVGLDRQSVGVHDETAGR